MSNFNFQYINLRNKDAEKAKLSELKEQGFTLIGLEMTDKEIASICERNIDPQHTDGAGDMCCAKLVAQRAPELLGWFKNRDLDKVIFVTDRFDVDSVAAYILADRYLRGESVALNENIEAINTHDTAAGLPWDGPKPIEKAFNPDNKTGALAASIKVFMLTENNVSDVRGFIDYGEVDDVVMNSFRASQQAVIDKVKSGEIKTEVVDGIAYVKSSERAATDVGYSLAPVVIAFNPVMPRADKTTYKKWTICKKLSKEENADEKNGGTPKYVDLKAVGAELAAKEQGWGGSYSLVGSPKDQDSELDIRTIGDVVYRHLSEAYKSQAKFQVAKSPVAKGCDINEIWVEENLFNCKTNLLDRKLQNEAIKDVIDLINRGVDVSACVEKVSRDIKKIPMTPFEKYISGILYRHRIRSTSYRTQMDVIQELGENMQKIALGINPDKLSVMGEIFASLSMETRQDAHVKNIEKKVNRIVVNRCKALYKKDGKGK